MRIVGLRAAWILGQVLVAASGHLFAVILARILFNLGRVRTPEKFGKSRGRIAHASRVWYEIQFAFTHRFLEYGASRDLGRRAD